MHPLLTEVRALIARGKPEDAVAKLAAALDHRDAELANELTAHQAALAKGRRNARRGLMTDEEHNVLTQKIGYALLDLMPEIEQALPPTDDVAASEEHRATETEARAIEDAGPPDAPVSFTFSGTHHAVLFATDRYAHFETLANPIHDADTLRDTLASTYGFSVELFRNPTRRQVLTTIRGYAERTYGEHDHLLIFFAGHGHFDEINGEGYLVLGDSRPLVEDAIFESYIGYPMLKTRIDRIGCNHILLVVDACFAGTLDRQIGGHRGDAIYDDITRAEFLQRKLKHRTRRYVTSGGKEYVPDGRPGHHSPFMRRFLEALRTYGGQDGLLTLNDFYHHLEYVKPEPRTGEFGDNEPGSDFVWIADPQLRKSSPV